MAAQEEDVDSAAALVAQVPVPADLPALVDLVVRAQRPVPADPVVRVQLPVLAERVVQAAASVEADSVEAVPVELRLSRQSFSAAMARSTT